MAATENSEKQNSNSKRMGMGMGMEEFTWSCSSKRRKIFHELSSSPANSAESVIKSATHNLEAIDLKLENSETDGCILISNGEFSGESSHHHQSKEEEVIKLSGGGELGEEMESPPPPPLSTPETQTTSMTSSNSLPKSGDDADRTTPSAAEIEDFFSAAEKYQQKRFAEKYNYDVVKDVPVEGRYKWIQMKL